MRLLLVIAAVIAGTALMAQPARACPQEELIKGFYHRYLHRCPQPCEVAAWVKQLRCGLSPEQAEIEFIASDEYWIGCGRCNETFVRQLYGDILGRETCRKEMWSWLDAMKCGDRRKVACLFLKESRVELSQRPAYNAPRVISPDPRVVPPDYQNGYSRQQGTYSSSGYRGQPSQPTNEQRIRIVYVR